MCDGVGLTLEEAANELERFDVKGSLNKQLLRRRIRRMGFIWREGRKEGGGDRSLSLASVLTAPGGGSRRRPGSTSFCLTGRAHQNQGHTKRMRVCSSFVSRSRPARVEVTFHMLVTCWMEIWRASSIGLALSVSQSVSLAWSRPNGPVQPRLSLPRQYLLASPC